MKSKNEIGEKLLRTAAEWKKSVVDFLYNPDERPKGLYTLTRDLMKLCAEHTSIDPQLFWKMYSQVVSQSGKTHYGNPSVIKSQQELETMAEECFGPIETLMDIGADKWNKLPITALTQVDSSSPSAATCSAEGEDMRPKDYLLGWPAILLALGKSNNAEDKEQVRNANNTYDGPIIFTKQGAQPKVVKEKLLAWYNHLEIVWQDMANQRHGETLEASNQLDYGRSEKTSTPDISGGVKKRRKDRKA